jgi:hypothetical protein
LGQKYLDDANTYSERAHVSYSEKAHFPYFENIQI